MGIRTAVCALAVALSPALASAQEFSVTYTDTLPPYGDWVVVESYGRVWRPHRAVVGVDFVPYASGGHWVHSNLGWVFEPDWAWGWLPFHYGRWFLDPFNGWVWVPDDVWAPAWVEWRVGGGYIGWAPSPPRYHQHLRHQWYFVESRHFVEPQIWHHRAVAVNIEITRPISPPSGRAWAAGPPVEAVRASAPLPISRTAHRGAPADDAAAPSARRAAPPDAGRAAASAAAAPRPRAEHRPHAAASAGPAASAATLRPRTGRAACSCAASFRAPAPRARPAAGPRADAAGPSAPRA